MVHIHCICRLEASRQELEKEHHISSCWSSTYPEYLEIVRLTRLSAKQKVKVGLLSAAKERTFYINAFAYHAGISDF